MFKLLHAIKSVFRVLNFWDAVKYLALIAYFSRTILRTKNLMSVDKAWIQLSSGEYAFWSGKTSVFLKRDDLSGVRELMGRRVYTRIPGFDVPVGGVCVDLGCNVGLFSLFCLANGARFVLSVEAQKTHLTNYIANMSRNSIEPNKYITVNAMVGEMKGIMASQETLTSLFPNNELPVTLRMNELFEKYDIQACDLLKIDIEGSEFALFQGTDDSIGWLSKVQKISAEVHPEFGDCREIRKRLELHGFSVLITDDMFCPTEVPTLRGGYLYAKRV